MYYVYHHKCKDGRTYVGMSKNPKLRWEGSGIHYADHPIFYSAIKEVGWNNMEHKILFESENKCNAREKEKEYATYYQSLGLSLNAGNGHSHSPSIENRIAVSRMRKSYVASKETRMKIGNANRMRKIKRQMLQLQEGGEG